MGETTTGEVIEGEEEITKANKKYKKFFYKEQPHVLPEVFDAIENADLIILSMGSLYTSVMPHIICKDVEGTVEDIGLVYTSLITVDNRKVTIPNGTVANATVINVTAQEKRQLDLEVNIDYGSDLKRAKEILLEILENHSQVIQEDGVRVFVKELGDSAVILGMRGWMMREEYWPARWDIIETIKLRFDEEGIVIPYKQIMVHTERKEL